MILTMLADTETAYRAVLERDARFDGRLFVGVTSTGIYCRPICRVRAPRRENCRFFETPAQAEAARFRPCLKCRPEVAPGPGPAWSVMDASRTLARQAADALEALAFEGTADAPAIAAVAARLGVSDRHLRRIFQAEHGVTPLQHLQTRRLLQAKQLLTDSRLPVTQVALASGFRSLRRFNAAFAERYRLSPSALRKGSRTGSRASEPAIRPPADDGAVDLHLGYRPPCDVAGLLQFFAQRAVPGVEAADPSALQVRRTLRPGLLAPVGGWIEASFEPSRHRVRLRLSPSLAARSAACAQAARRWLDLDADPLAIEAVLSPEGDGEAREAGPHPGGRVGTRLPGCLDGFELAVRAVLGQRVTVAGARTLASRLVQAHGEAVTTPFPELHRLHPSPAALAAASPDELGRLGLLRMQVTAIQSLARLEPELQAIEHGPASLPLRAAALIERLVALPGLGPWTAHYLAMRRLGWTDAFPPGDVAVLKALGLGRNAQALREAEARAESWRPWRAYAVLRLWQTLETPR